MRGCAYWSGATQDAMSAREHLSFARILPAGPWRYKQVSIAGKPGVLAAQSFGEDLPSFNPEDYLAARPCSDGLLFYAPKVPTPQALLAKTNAVRGLDVLTSRGVQLSVPLVTLAPKFISFTGGDLTPATELEQLALKVWERIESAARAASEAKASGLPAPSGVDLIDPDVLRVVFLGIEQNYRVTAESLEGLGWITTRDVQPILNALEGYDPKSEAAGKPSSPSLPAAL